ncbi:MAG: type II toxin-antitoxin system RelE family toxin [Parachlamydiaceae bacterium]
MKYEVEVIGSAKKALKNIEAQYIKKILERIDFLQIDPRHYRSIKLSGKENTYRTRVGKYRIVYEIYDEKVLVIVVNVDHRKDIYR